MISYTISNDKLSGYTENHVALCINNNDKSPRWIWPAKSKRPIFLQFYHASTWRQKLYTNLIQLIFLLRLQRIVFKSISISNLQGLQGDNWAVFTGTIGPNRKQVVIKSENSILKIATEELAIINLENEFRILKNLDSFQGECSFVFPKVISNIAGNLEIEKLSSIGPASTFNEQHIAALRTMRSINYQKCNLAEWSKWKDIHFRLNELKNARNPNIPNTILKILTNWVVLFDMQQQLDLCLFHGDFTPWNCFKTEASKLAIIDWELGKDKMPVGFDFFHFHMQKGIMIDRKNWNDIYAEIGKNLNKQTIIEVFGTEDIDVKGYLKLYLIYHISYYLSIYLHQPKWHQQVYWQIDVWSDALLALSEKADQRKMLITRLFDMLHQFDYAVLKIGQTDPLSIDAYSDLDILVRQSDIEYVLKKITICPSVKRINVVKKSFMASVFVVLNDEQTLSLDFIWKIKRRSTVFLETEELLKNAYVNSFGVKVTSDRDNERYIALFYGLNGGVLPANKSANQSEIYFPKLSENRNFKKLKNQFFYLKDTLSNMIYNRGYVLTFSGVDGAGKSTVISEMSKVIDKKLRKPVKILRHRPSILPILSAYIYGKAEAELKSVKSLPRTGTNSNTISSLFRFGYYYIDYLIGQWYIYFRYILKGYVVIYDRYYYDFILDPKRTNIIMPSSLAMIGLKFIKKPKFNFFLYADPEVILSRKKEMDYSTIQDLTAGYKSFFAKSAFVYQKVTFQSIENFDLDETLHKLSNVLISKIN